MNDITKCGFFMNTGPKQSGLRIVFGTLVLLGLAATSVLAGDGTWTNKVDGLWSVSGNWSGGSVASGAGFTASFTNAGGVTVNQDSPSLTIGNMFFTNGSYTISSNTIALSGGNMITVATNTASTISSVFTGGAGLTKLGDGTLILSGTNTYTGTTAINAGTLNLKGVLAGSTITFGSNGVPGGSLIINNPAALPNVTSVLIHGGSITLVTDSVLSNAAAMSIGRTVWNDGPFSITVDRATPGDGVNHTFGTLMPFDKGVITFLCGSNTCGATPLITFDTVSPFGAFNNAVVATVTPVRVNLRFGNMMPIAASGGSANQYNQRIFLDGTSQGNQITGVMSDTATVGYTNWLCVTKANTSVWILSGTNTYTGDTTITGGKLVGVTGGSCANSAVTVNNVSSTLGILITDNTKQWTCGNLAFTAIGRLDFDFGTVVTPSAAMAPLLVTNNVGFNSTPTVTVSGSTNLLAGNYPLMTWTSRSGTAPATAILPPHVTGGGLTIGGTTLNLNIITNTQPLTWTNAVAGLWDVGAFNWKDSAGTSSSYQETLVSGDMVIFDDTPGTGSSAVTLNSALTPARVIINNTNRNYTVSGIGRITGTADLTKNGAGTFTISTTNDYTGVTTINAGALAIGGNGTLYGGTSRGTITNNGAFVYGSTATQILYGAISGTGSVTCAGSGTLIFAVASSYAGETRVSGGILQVNQASLATNADVRVSTGGRLNLNFSGTNTIRSLHINNGAVQKGTYGATGSGAQIIRDDVLSGSGILNVMVGTPGTVIRVQ